MPHARSAVTEYNGLESMGEAKDVDSLICFDIDTTIVYTILYTENWKLLCAL